MKKMALKDAFKGFDKKLAKPKLNFNPGKLKTVAKKMKINAGSRST